MRKIVVFISLIMLFNCHVFSQVRGMKRQVKVAHHVSEARNRAQLRLATEWVDSVMRPMTLRQQIAQLMCIRVPLDLEGKKQREFEQLIRETEVGGVCFFVGTAKNT